jgi:hypothetical protein
MLAYFFDGKLYCLFVGQYTCLWCGGKSESSSHYFLFDVLSYRILLPSFHIE